MLVKFLSFVISVLGTARYKAVFLSCVALVLSLTGITALVLHSSSQPRDASAAVEQTKDGVGTQNFSPQLPSNKQPAKEQPEQSQTDNQNSSSNTSTAPDNSSSNTTKQPTASDFGIVIGKIPATVAADSTSDAITVSTSDNSAVNWQFATDNDGAHIITTQNTASSSASFQIQTSKNMPSGTIITVAVSVRDNARGINTTKTFTVTIQ